jgi:hypothetical protein
MLKSTSRLGSDRDITDITLTATIIRIVITGRTMATTGLTTGTAGTVTTAATITKWLGWLESNFGPAFFCGAGPQKNEREIISLG